MLIAAWICLQSCAARLLVAGLEAAEVEALVVRGAMLPRYGLAVAGTELVVVDEAAFLSRLARVRIESGALSSPRLFVYEDGVRRYFGRVGRNSRIDLLDINKSIPLPANSSLYRVRNAARVRTGPGTHYDVYKLEGASFLEKDQVVLVLREIGGWYEVQLGREAFGYIAASLLLPISSEEDNKAKTCDICHGDGYHYKDKNCSTCNATGKLTCPECNGNRKFVCRECNGATKFTCKDCGGNGKFVCEQCSGKGYLGCRSCKGFGTILTARGLQQCAACYGTGRNSCTRCYATGTYSCTRCYATGTYSCTYCYATGYLSCSRCYQTGSVSCTVCRGYKTISQKVQCNKCDGMGYVLPSKRTGSSPINSIFTDFFTSNFHNWPLDNNQTLSSSIADGSLFMRSQNEAFHYTTVAVPLSTGRDYVISATTKHIEGVLNYGYGIIFSKSAAGDFYAFAVADKFYKLLRYKSGRFEDVIAWTETDMMRKGASVNTLKIEKKGSDCYLYLNGSYVNKVLNMEEFGNATGFFVENMQSIAFDDLRVYQEYLPESSPQQRSPTNSGRVELLLPERVLKKKI